MSDLTRIVAGGVVNNGIYDGSKILYTPTTAGYPSHYPVIGVVTPKGPMGQQNISMSNFAAIYGDIMKSNTPYYTPISLLIQMLASGGQTSLGIRRLSGNTVNSRIILGVTVTEGSIPNNKREPDGSFSINASGAYIPLVPPTKPGYVFSVGTFDLKLDVGSQSKITITDPDTDKKSITYPLVELVAGIGDDYNKSGIDFGVGGSTDWTAVSKFVETNGVFPFDLRMFTVNTSGSLSYQLTANGSDGVDFALFNFTGNGMSYGPDQAIGEYTGNNVNRPHEVHPAPINTCFVYTKHIEELTQFMYDIESANTDNKILTDNNFDYPHRQMNPFTGVNHNGIPYYSMSFDDSTAEFHGKTHLRCDGGLSPFKGNDGEYIVAVDTLTNIFGVKSTAPPVFDRMLGWEATQKLVLDDLIQYTADPNLHDWTRNRQSFIWDVGYNEPIKDALIDLWAQRKDQVIALAANIYGDDMSPADSYSMATSLCAKLRLFSESDKFGTPACRALINLWDARVINATVPDRFSLNLDLAYTFAKFGGNSEGMLYKANCPDHANNRIIQKQYDPLVTFESDDPSSNNFDSGCVTVRPYDQKQFYRPALISVYDDPDSVLKDFTTTYVCVAIEKSCSDQWSTVSGDTTISSVNYAAIMKDNCEGVCRNNYGSMVKDIIVDAYYDESSQGGRAILKLRVSVWFNKGKYMMDMDLYAFNEEDSSTN